MKQIPFLDELKQELLEHAPQPAEKPLQYRRSRLRLSGAWVAAAVFVGTLVVGGLTWLLTGSSPVTEEDPAETMVSYVRLDWSQEVEMRCEGMETVDNSGFDNAVVEIWGPTSDGIFRVDATAPDGTVETLIARMNEEGQPLQTWASPEDVSDSVFRISECTSRTGNASRSVSMADPPIHPRPAVFPRGFVGFPFRLLDGTTVDLADLLGRRSDSERIDTWRGVPVTVFITSDEFTDEYGLNERVEEVWVDLEHRRYERYLLDYNIEKLGHLMLTIETEERSSPTVDQDFFSTDGLTLTHDTTEAEQPTDTTLSDRNND